jgi:ABC-2 type transport system ATP-binding protein
MDDISAVTTSTGDLLDVSNLSVGYGGRPVLTGINLALRRGEILGLLGANGSGKSTLIKAITGQMQPQGGTVTIDGVALGQAPERAKARLGLAIDAADLPPFLSGRQYLELIASIRGCGPADRSCGDLIERLAISPWLDRPIAECSLGTRAKIAIVAALLGLPPLLIFDESLSGLDPIAAWEVKAFLSGLATSGDHAVIVSTHIVEAIPGFCNRAVFLAEGSIVENWGASALYEAAGRPGAFEACLMQTLRRHAGRAAEV